MTLESGSEEQIIQTQAAYTALLQSPGSSTCREIEVVMAEREQVAPEEGLTPEVVQALKNRIKVHYAPAVRS